MSDSKPVDPYISLSGGQTPTDGTSRRSSKIRTAFAVLTVLLLIIFCAGLLLPSITRIAPTVRKMTCSSNIRQIAVALHHYEAKYGSLPPTYTVNEAGQRLHSWRTLILPFLGQKQLYEQIDLSKPWDARENSNARTQVLSIFNCPEHPNSAMTAFVAIDDASGVFNGALPQTIDRFTDSNTILCVEASGNSTIEWMEPRDLTATEYLEILRTGQASTHWGGGHLVFLDGSVRYFSADIDPQIVTDLLAGKSSQQ